MNRNETRMTCRLRVAPATTTVRRDGEEGARRVVVGTVVESLGRGTVVE